MIKIFSASVSLMDITSERVKEITFNDKCPEQFALTTDHHVLFLTWVGEKHVIICIIVYILD